MALDLQKKMLLSIVIFCFAGEAKAVNFTQKTEIEYQAQDRILNQTGLSSYDSMLDHYFILKSNLLLDLNSSWGLEVQPEIRTLWGKSTKLPLTDPAALGLPKADRLFGSDGLILDNSESVGTINLERMNLVYRYDQGEVLLGRRAVSLGNFRTLIILNKFAIAPLQSPGYPFYFGQDGATVSFGSSFYQIRAISILGDHRERDVHLLETKFSGDGFEVQLLGGQWWDRAAVGFAPTVDVMGSSLRAEVLGVPKDDMWQVGVGFERALDSNFKLVIESMYQSLGVKDSSGLTLRSPSPYMIFRSRFLALAQVEFTGLSFWNFSTGLARSFTDDSMMGSARVQYSISDHWDTYLDSRFPLTSSRGEFSSQTLTFAGGRTLGQSSYVSFGLKFYF